MSCRTAFLACTAIALLSTLGCGGSDGGAPAGVIAPPPLSIGGDWSTAATESLDTCGFDPPPVEAPLHVEDNGDSAVFTFADPYGFCETSVRDRSGSVVHMSRTDTFDGGCGLVQVHAEIVYEFSDSDNFSGTAHYRYSTLSGFCSNLPCDYVLDISGSRCQDCWFGCFSSASAPETPARAARTESLQHIAPAL